MAHDRNTALVWFRRDLRLADHPALAAAVACAKQIIPVYIYSPAEERGWPPGAASRWWLHHSLLALDASLKRKRSRLIIRAGSSLDALRTLVRETGASRVFWNRLYDPALVKRDTRVKRALRELGCDVDSYSASLIHEPWQVVRDNGAPYRVFTPYYKASLAAGLDGEPLRAPRTVRPAKRWPPGLAVAELRLLPRSQWFKSLESTWSVGEHAARRRLQTFAHDRLGDYAENRDCPAQSAVSRLSPHLHFGELSARQVWKRTQDSATTHRDARIDAYLRQLIWRDFAHQLLYHFPDTPRLSFDRRFDEFPWRARRNSLFDAWTRGTTGVPLVDAGMRELWNTGWMHNRVRMIAASFLTKNAMIHWRLGARWFWDTLVDADLANNTLGWQWVAGCGADAAPYFRVFNPVRQGERFDPRGEYVRRWVPELANLPDHCIHTPWEASPLELSEAGVRLGDSYPHPVLDLQESRAEALQRYRYLAR